MLRWALEIVSYIVLFGVLLFAPAGTLHWWRAWVLLIVLSMARVIGTISIARVNASVLHERSKPVIQKGQPFVDKVLVTLFMATFAGLVAFVSLDHFHLHIFSAPPLFISTAGMILFIFGWIVITMVLRANPFASAVVRHQKERNHSVVSDGIYRIVRHPMYSGLASVMIGLALWLESYASALFALIPTGIFVIRIFVEEKLLRRELQDYENYAKAVRWRMIPGIW
jgi:protein-S-isoprenylcysteine O-methyltransferase Ste14